MFIFSQRRRHDYHMAFSLLESVHRIISPVQTIPTLQTYPESCYISCKTKVAGLPPIPLNVYFLPTQTTRLSLPESVRRITPPVQTILTSQTYPESCYIHEKQKRQGFHPYRLMFIFCQRRRHGCHRAFSLLESVHRIAPPMQIDSHHTSLFWKLLHLMQNKSGRASTIPLNVYLFPTQTARLPHGVFSTRICASNRSANADT